MAATIKVLLGEMPQTLREILEHALRDQRHIVLVNDRWSVASVSEIDEGPDVLILGRTAQDEREPDHALLGRWLKARVLMVTEAGRSTVLYELRPHRTELGELSPAELVDAIGAAARRATFTAYS